MFELPRRRNELYIIHFCFILYNYRCFVVVFMMHLNVKLPYFLSVPVWFFSSVCTFEPWSSSFVNISRMHSGSEKGQGWKKDLCRLLTYLWRKLVNAVFHKALVILIKTLIYKKVLEILTKILGWQVFCFVFFFPAISYFLLLLCVKYIWSQGSSWPWSEESAIGCLTKVQTINHWQDGKWITTLYPCSCTPGTEWKHIPPRYTERH